MATVVGEKERKYEPGDAGVAAISGLADVGRLTGPTEMEIDNSYLDTDDLRLAAAGVTLRRRTGGGESGWQLKLPAGADTRQEVRAASVEGAGLQPPPEIIALTRAFTRDAPLTQVASIVTTRRQWNVLDAQGRVVAELVEDSVQGHRTGPDTTAVAWEEVEVELGPQADAAVLDGIERRLVDTGARRSAVGSKLQRVLGERWPDAPHDPETGTAGGVVLAQLRQHADTLRSWDPQVRLGTSDAVHQMRVTARRMRSLLQAFGKTFDQERTRDLIEGLRWLGEELGGARDLEVVQERFRGAVAQLPGELVLGPVDAELTRAFADKEADAGKRAMAALDSDRYLALLAGLDALLDEPPLTRKGRRKAGKELRKQLARAGRRLDRRLGRAHAAGRGEERDTALHDVRKAAKRLRYAATATSTVLGKPARKLAKRAKRLQQTLGEHHDSVVARPLLRSLAVAAHSSGGNGFTYGLLHEAERRRARDCERHVPDLERKLRKAAGKVWS